MPSFRAGLLAFVTLAVLSVFGLTRLNPFANPYELEALFRTANNLQPNSPVRIAGVDVGKVTKVEPVDDPGGGARVTMEIKKKGLPIHEDARLKVRPRVFLEGNFFVDLNPGSASSPILEEGERAIPLTQTAAPVQIGQVLAALQSDTRADLQTFLYEYARGLEGGGARAFNRSIRYWERAYRGTAVASDATLGEQPTRDLRRLLRGQQRTAAALAQDDAALQGLVTNFNTVAGALAREDRSLEASLPALRDTLRAGYPALASLNDALPSLRVFAREALPSVRSSEPALEASLPFLRQLRGLVRTRELRGLSDDLRDRAPALARLTRRSVPLLVEARAIAACSNEVLTPFFRSRIPDPDFPANSNQRVMQQVVRSFVGLAGESRINDGNTPLYRIQGVSPLGLTGVRPVAPRDGGDAPPEHRPDIPCETQEPPNLNAPGGAAAQFTGAKRLARPVPLRKWQSLVAAEKRRIARAQRRAR